MGRVQMEPAASVAGEDVESSGKQEAVLSGVKLAAVVEEVIAGSLRPVCRAPLPAVILVKVFRPKRFRQMPKGRKPCAMMPMGTVPDR